MNKTPYESNSTECTNIVCTVSCVNLRWTRTTSIRNPGHLGTSGLYTLWLVNAQGAQASHHNDTWCVLCKAVTMNLFYQYFLSSLSCLPFSQLSFFSSLFHSLSFFLLQNGPIKPSWGNGGQSKLPLGYGAELRAQMYFSVTAIAIT